MKVQPIRSSLASVESDTLAIGLFDGDFIPPPSLEATPLAETRFDWSRRKKSPGRWATSSHCSAWRTRGWRRGRSSCSAWGLARNSTRCAAFSAGSAVAKKLASRPRKHVFVALPDDGEPDSITSALVEGLIVGTRGPDLRKTEPSRHAFETLSIVGPAGAHGRVRAGRPPRARSSARRSISPRDLANTPPAEKRPTMLAATGQGSRRAAGIDGHGLGRGSTRTGAVRRTAGGRGRVGRPARVRRSWNIGRGGSPRRWRWSAKG